MSAKRITTILSLVLVLLVASAVLAALIAQPSRKWWYEAFLPWVEPAATVLAVLAAIVAGIYAAMALAREEARDARRELDERKRQAANVAGWIEFEWAGDGRANWQHWPFHLRNASALPVTEVGVWLYTDTMTTEGGTQLFHCGGYPVLPPSDQPERHRLRDSYSTFYLAIEEDPSWASNERPIPEFVLLFTDSAGVRWLRTPKELVELSYGYSTPDQWQRADGQAIGMTYLEG